MTFGALFICIFFLLTLDGSRRVAVSVSDTWRKSCDYPLLEYGQDENCAGGIVRGNTLSGSCYSLKIMTYLLPATKKMLLHCLASNRFVSETLAPGSPLLLFRSQCWTWPQSWLKELAHLNLILQFSDGDRHVRLASIWEFGRARILAESGGAASSSSMWSLLVPCRISTQLYEVNHITALYIIYWYNVPSQNSDRTVIIYLTPKSEI